jgi:hypothetical protein
MNYTQSFEEFSTGLGPTDLALYAGVGVVLLVLFKDQMSPVQKFILDLFNKAKDTVADLTERKVTPEPVPLSPVPGPIPVTPSSPAPILVRPDSDPNKVFFEMVASWKQTRDLAVKHGCEEAVKSLDDTFQYLAPTVCEGENNE